jgi:hypothetical protein
VRDRLAASQRDWLEMLATATRIAIAEGHFRRDVDPAQLAHELLALAYGGHLMSRLLKDRSTEGRLRKAVDHLLVSARAPKN